MSSNIELEWVINWFFSRGGIPRAMLEQSENLDYIDERMLDSLGVVELIAAVEQEFDVAFDYELMRDSRFTTVAGFAQIIAELRSGQAATLKGEI